MRKLKLMAAVLLGTVTACTPSAATTAGTQPAARVTTVTGAAATAWPPGFVLPDRHLTPGAIRHDPLSMICPRTSKVLEDLRPDAAVKAQVYLEYHIWHHTYGQYEVDHLVPVELDGADTPANLWPEPDNTASPATIRAEHLDPAFILNSKDILEDVLHRDVCDGQLSLATAQHAIATDWRTAYLRYVGKP